MVVVIYDWELIISNKNNTINPGGLYKYYNLWIENNEMVMKGSQSRVYKLEYSLHNMLLLFKWKELEYTNSIITIVTG